MPTRRRPHLGDVNDLLANLPQDDSDRRAIHPLDTNGPRLAHPQSAHAIGPQTILVNNDTDETRASHRKDGMTHHRASDNDPPASHRHGGSNLRENPALDPDRLSGDRDPQLEGTDHRLQGGGGEVAMRTTEGGRETERETGRDHPGTRTDATDGLPTSATATETDEKRTGEETVTPTERGTVPTGESAIVAPTEIAILIEIGRVPLTEMAKIPATEANAASAEEPPAKRVRKADTTLATRTGGAYIPPAKLRMMQEAITDKSRHVAFCFVRQLLVMIVVVYSSEYQRMSWEALKKSINGLINKANVSNLKNIVMELFQENIVRGRGLLARSIIQAQAASPTFTHVYAALVAIINTKFPQNGELILRRLTMQFKRGYKRNDKNICLTATKFIAHLVNQQVAHELLALEILTLLLENPTDDSVEVAVGFLKDSGQKLGEVSPRGIHAIFERLRSILHEAQIDKRVQYMIEVMFAVRKDNFQNFPSIAEGLDMVDEEDQITHLISLDDELKTEDILNVFKVDPEFLQNEEKYKLIKKEAKMQIEDMTETNLVALRRTIYLTVQSSLDFEECAHKMMKMDIKPGQEYEFCHMIVDCCSQQRSYEKFFGLLGQRFCQLKKEFVAEYEKIFVEQYTTCHRLETNKLRNVAKFFGHLLYTDAIPWTVLECIHLNEEETTSSSRIFIKILFQELSEYMGLQKLNARFKDQFYTPYFEGLFPRDNPRNTRFSINFFTSIGLGGLTDELREHLKNAPKLIMQQTQEVDSSDSDSEDDRKKKKKKAKDKREAARQDKDKGKRRKDTPSPDTARNREPPKATQRRETETRNDRYDRARDEERDYREREQYQEREFVRRRDQPYYDYDAPDERDEERYEPRDHRGRDVVKYREEDQRAWREDGEREDRRREQRRGRGDEWEGDRNRDYDRGREREWGERSRERGREERTERETGRSGRERRDEREQDDSRDWGRGRIEE
ncbi:pre-mRNA-splicing factor cwc22 [Branchiostoma belcheri]|nr:pre-mRNA-splicing factor cwc22 [Branchiostoma belcheri]